MTANLVTSNGYKQVNPAIIATVVLLLVALVLFAGSQWTAEQEGPAEQIGEKIDKGVEQTKDTHERASDR